jgi:RNA polymerase sigma-70 factor (ECF subfamily)
MLDFAEIYDEQLPRVYGYIAYRVGSRPDAEDLTQQTFERAFEHWSRFDRRRASPATWLLTIAHNLVIDHQRAGARSPAAASLEDVEPAALPTLKPAAPPGISPELETALAQLDGRERDLLALRYGAELSGREIAAITELSVANVQQILARALRKLRASFEKS